MAESVNNGEIEQLLRGNSHVEVTMARWVILLIFMALSFLVSFEIASFGQVNNVYAAYYNVNYGVIDWIFNGYNVGKLVICPIFAYLVSSNYVSLRWLTIIAFISLIGACICAIISLTNPTLLVLLIFGQVILGISGSIKEAYPSIFSPIWFQANEVGTAIGLVEASIGAGYILAFNIPTNLLVYSSEITTYDNNSFETTDQDWIESNRQTAMNIYLVLFVISFVLLILTLKYVKDEPPFPPTLAQAFKRTNRDKTTNWSCSNFFYTSKHLFCDKTFVLLSFSFGIALHIGHIEFILMQEIVQHFTQDTNFIVEYDVKSGYVMTAYASGVLTGSLIAGKLVNVSKKLHLQTVVGTVMGFISTFALFLCHYFDKLIPFIICNAAFGISTRISGVAFYEMVTQHTYPTDEALVSVWMTWIRAGAEIAFLLLARLLHEYENKMSALLLQTTSLLLCSILTCLLKPENKKEEMDEKLGQEKNVEETSTGRSNLAN